MRKANVRRVMLLILVVLGLLVLPTVVFAQGEGESLPDNIVDFFSIDGLAVVLGAAFSIGQYWLAKAGLDGTVQQMILTVIQAVVAVLIIVVAGLVPTDMLQQYNTFYVAIRAFLVAFLGNQGMYRLHAAARKVAE